MQAHSTRKSKIGSSLHLAGKILPKLRVLQREFTAFLLFLNTYLTDKGKIFSTFFEGNKNAMVKSILIKRGKRNRMFLHVSAMVVLTLGVVISPLISDSNPFSDKKNAQSFAQEFDTPSDYLLSEDVFKTSTSEKPRDKVITYKVQKGDTISTIAKKFGISDDTIRWGNNLRGDAITVGDDLQILPVTGISHKVESGDTIYSIAKKYSTYPQNIVDFPFNEFANPQTFSLVVGQMLVVPEGVKPADQPRYVRQTYIATGPVSVTGAGFTWPLRGALNQTYSWYHRGIDIGASVGSPIVAAQSGSAAQVFTGGWNGGYGVHVIIQGSNGYSTLYAHLSGVNINQGDSVVAGKTVIGWVGLTGRTTGAHLHFEVRGNDLINPMAFLQ